MFHQSVLLGVYKIYILVRGGHHKFFQGVLQGQDPGVFQFHFHYKLLYAIIVEGETFSFCVKDNVFCFRYIDSHFVSTEPIC